MESVAVLVRPERSPMMPCACLLEKRKAWHPGGGLKIKHHPLAFRIPFRLHQFLSQQQISHLLSHVVLTVTPSDLMATDYEPAVTGHWGGTQRTGMPLANRAEEHIGK